jgi:hypothetical protein
VRHFLLCESATSRSQSITAGWRKWRSACKSKKAKQGRIRRALSDARLLPATPAASRFSREDLPLVGGVAYDWRTKQQCAPSEQTGGVANDVGDVGFFSNSRRSDAHRYRRRPLGALPPAQPSPAALTYSVRCCCPATRDNYPRVTTRVTADTAAL